MPGDAAEAPRGGAGCCGWKGRPGGRLPRSGPGVSRGCQGLNWRWICKVGGAGEG